MTPDQEQIRDWPGGYRTGDVVIWHPEDRFLRKQGIGTECVVGSCDECSPRRKGEIPVHYAADGSCSYLKLDDFLTPP